MKYVWIKDHRDEFPVNAMCKVLTVSRSGFYKSLHATPSQRALRSQRIREQVEQLHEQSHCNYGSYKISRAMRENHDLESACRNTVAKAMQEMGLKSRIRKKFKPKTSPNSSSHHLPDCGSIRVPPPDIIDGFNGRAKQSAFCTLLNVNDTHSFP